MKQPRSSCVLEVQQVAKKFNKQVIFSQLDLEIQNGKLHFLVGANGVGKSTLLKMMAGHLAPDQGQVIRSLAGNKFGPHPDYYIVTESIEYPAQLKLETIFSLARDFYPGCQWPSFINKCQSYHLPLDRSVGQLSRGQKMLGALLFGLCSGARVLLVDEVAAVLDARNRHWIMGELGAFCAQGGTVVVATNIILPSQHLNDRLLLLQDGKIALAAGLDELNSHFIKLRLSQSSEQLEKVLQLGAMDLYRNGDGSTSYLIKRSPSMELIENWDPLLDRRAITSEDIFLFYSRPQLVSELKEIA